MGPYPPPKRHGSIVEEETRGTEPADAPEPSSRCHGALTSTDFVGLSWSGALERCDGASLESLAQHIDALGGVVAIAILVDAAERVVRQAAQEKARER